MSDRIVRCKYDNCTAEAVDVLGEIRLCTKHLGRAYEMLTRVGAPFRAELAAAAAKEN
jgi:hypothetical protein